MQGNVGKDVPSLQENGVECSCQPIIIERLCRSPKQKLCTTIVCPLANMHQRFWRTQAVGHQGINNITDRDLKPCVCGAMEIDNFSDIHLFQDRIYQD
ncbi:hypothetical protein ES703_75785 [subsurface metagenome]